MKLTARVCFPGLQLRRFISRWYAEPEVAKVTIRLASFRRYDGVAGGPYNSDHGDNETVISMDNAKLAEISGLLHILTA